MKVLFLLIAFLLYSNVPAFARVGLAEIYFETPGGHGICHCDPYGDDEVPVLIGQEEKIKQLDSWYFYKKHIVGKGKGYFFIFNEANEQLSYFTNEEQWEESIRSQHLNPFITRWLDLSDAPDNLLIFLFFASFIAVPVLLIGFIVLIILAIRKKIHWNKRVLMYSATGIVLFGLYVWMTLHPGSI